MIVINYTTIQIAGDLYMTLISKESSLLQIAGSHPKHFILFAKSPTNLYYCTIMVTRQKVVQIIFWLMINNDSFITHSYISYTLRAVQAKCMTFSDSFVNNFAPSGWLLRHFLKWKYGLCSFGFVFFFW